MNNKNNQRGSSIILVISFVSIMMIMLTVASRNCMLACDIALQRTRYEQQALACQGLLNYLVVLAQDNYAVLSKPLEIKDFRWPVGARTCNAAAQIKPDKNTLALKAALLEGATPLYSIACNMAQVKQGDKVYYQISNWRIEPNDTQQ